MSKLGRRIAGHFAEFLEKYGLPVAGGGTMFAFLAAGALLLYQTYKFLKFGTWEMLTVSDLLSWNPTYSFEWMGIQKIAEWLTFTAWAGCLPLTAGVLASGAGAAMLKCGERLQEAARQRRGMESGRVRPARKVMPSDMAPARSE